MNANYSYLVPAKIASRPRLQQSCGGRLLICMKLFSAGHHQAGTGVFRVIIGGGLLFRGSWVPRWTWKRNGVLSLEE